MTNLQQDNRREAPKYNPVRPRLKVSNRYRPKEVNVLRKRTYANLAAIQKSTH